MLDYNKVKNIVIDNPVDSIEFRFNNINSHHYHVLMDNLNKNSIGKEQLSTMYYSDMGIRKYAQDTIDTLFQKKIISASHNKDYDVDVVFTSIVSKKSVDNFSYNMIRDKIKHIYTFPIGNATYTIELSEIVIDNNAKIYEIEVKYTHNDFLRITQQDIDTLNAAIVDLLLILNQTKILYTVETKQKLLADYVPFVRGCRFFTFDDIRTPSIQTIKAKGKKCSLVIHYTGIWLVKAPYEYNLIIEPVDNIINVMNAWSITVYEGQLVKPVEKDAYNFNYHYWYLCNDCSMIRGKDVTNEGYDKRFEYMKEFKNRISFFIDEDYLTFGLQSQRYANNPDQFHQNCRDLLSLSDEVNYDTDGLMITPIYGTEKLKWMDKNQIYIDFITYHNKLYVIQKGEEVLFEGTKQYPFDGVDNSFEPTKNKQIISCAFNIFQHNNNIGNTFQHNGGYDNILHCSVRLDKEHGDTLDTAIENWNYIHHPIDIETIKGDTTVIADTFIADTFNQYVLNNRGLVVDDLTPYWENSDSLDFLVDYIDVELEQNDKFVFLTLDGDAVIHLFRSDVISLKIGPVTIIKNEDRTVTFIYSNGISKTVYLVHLMDLSQRLKDFGIYLEYTSHMTDDKLLTTEGNIYASLYMYGYYIRK